MRSAPLKAFGVRFVPLDSSLLLTIFWSSVS
jgi:hypothetical protein